MTPTISEAGIFVGSGPSASRTNSWTPTGIGPVDNSSNSWSNSVEFALPGEILMSRNLVKTELTDVQDLPVQIFL